VNLVSGVDLGGTAINYTLVDAQAKFLIEGLCEHPARSKEGPDICLAQIAEGLKIAVAKAGVSLSDVVAVGLDTPGPASAAGVLSAKGATNFVHAKWSGYDIRGNLEKRLGKPVTYLNDGNAAVDGDRKNVPALFSTEISESSAVSVAEYGRSGEACAGAGGKRRRDVPGDFPRTGARPGVVFR
jgi:hypothetical protein